MLFKLRSLPAGGQGAGQLSPRRKPWVGQPILLPLSPAACRPAGRERDNSAQGWEAVKKLTASRKGAKAQRKAECNSFGTLAGLCGFRPSREVFCLSANFFTPSGGLGFVIPPLQGCAT
jgi:hypothetical protein